MEEVYSIMIAFALNLGLLIVSEVLGMTKTVKPNSITELLSDSVTKIIAAIEKRSITSETSER